MKSKRRKMEKVRELNEEILSVWKLTLVQGTTFLHIHRYKPPYGVFKTEVFSSIVVS